MTPLCLTGLTRGSFARAADSQLGGVPMKKFLLQNSVSVRLARTEQFNELCRFVIFHDYRRRHWSCLVLLK